MCVEKEVSEEYEAPKMHNARNLLLIRKNLGCLWSNIGDHSDSELAILALSCTNH